MKLRRHDVVTAPDGIEWTVVSVYGGWPELFMRWPLGNGEFEEFRTVKYRREEVEQWPRKSAPVRATLP